MAELNKRLLQEQLEAAAEKIAELPRHHRGHQGLVTVEDVVVVCVYRSQEDNQLYYADPSEISDEHPDLFLRDYVIVGRQRRGVRVVELLERFLPIVSPGAAGIFSAIKGIFGKRG